MAGPLRKWRFAAAPEVKWIMQRDAWLARRDPDKQRQGLGQISDVHGHGRFGICDTG